MTKLSARNAIVRNRTEPLQPDRAVPCRPKLAGGKPKLAGSLPRTLVVLAVPLLVALALSACGSSASSTAASQAGPSQSAATSATCQDVSAVLSDGPDPDADPVGYAEAQIVPLQRIHSQDTALQSAITQLAAAYQQFFTSDGTKTAKEAVSVASNKINSFCPGATS
jgi:hypothetical protein